MRSLAMIGALALGISGVSLANTAGTTGLPEMKTECKGGSVTRHIWISYENTAGEGCKVHYTKPDENAPEKVLWTAQNDPNFCQDKAKAFIEKQKTWNFTCTPTIN